MTAKRFYRVSWLDSLITLSHVAAVTERVNLGTSILIAPLRQPAVLAKEVATLHHFSGERYIFGVGVGWYGPEFEACGVTSPSAVYAPMRWSMQRCACWGGRCHVQRPLLHPRRGDRRAASAT